MISEIIEVSDPLKIVWVKIAYCNRLGTVTMIKQNIYTVKFYDRCELLFLRTHIIKH